MKRKVMGVFLQLVGVVILFFGAQIIPQSALIGIGLIIAGGLFFRKAKESSSMGEKSAVEKIVSVTIVIICALVIGLILMIVIPNFIKGFNAARQQRLQTNTSVPK